MPKAKKDMKKRETKDSEKTVPLDVKISEKALFMTVGVAKGSTPDGTSFEIVLINGILPMVVIKGKQVHFPLESLVKAAEKAIA